MSRHRKRKRYAFRKPSRLPRAAAGKMLPAQSRPIVDVIAFGPDKFVEKRIDDLEQLKGLVGQYPVVWVNVDGLCEHELVCKLGEDFGLHSLALEDVVHVHQRAKVEAYGDHLFVVARMIDLGEQLDTEQVSFFLGKNFLLSFQERAGGDSFDDVRLRLRKGLGKLRSGGADYLLYALLDGVVDGYFPVLERFGERLEQLEEDVVEHYNRHIVARIHEIKTDLLLIRRALWPHREAIHSLVRDQNPFIQDETRWYLRDCYDHTVQLFDLVETYRELGADLRDLYLSSAGQRLNEIMKVLTVVSTIFIPLTFIAGIYGMNFDYKDSPWNMPELRAYFGYPAVLAIMVLMAIGMLSYFRRKGWLGMAEDGSPPVPSDQALESISTNAPASMAAAASADPEDTAQNGKNHDGKKS